MSKTKIVELKKLRKAWDLQDFLGMKKSRSTI